MQLESFEIPDRPNQARLVSTHEHFGIEYVFRSAVLQILSLDILSDQLSFKLKGLEPQLPREHDCYRLELVLAIWRDRDPNAVLKASDGSQNPASTCCTSNVPQGLFVCEPQNRTQAIAKILRINGPMSFKDLYLSFADTHCTLAGIADFEVKIAKLLQNGFLTQYEDFRIGIVPNEQYIQNVKNSKSTRLSASAKERRYL